jgi:hypothetical protein
MGMASQRYVKSLGSKKINATGLTAAAAQLVFSQS